jgi:hypothetical protein
MIELTTDIDEQLRAGQEELEAHLEAQGVEIPVPAGTVPRRAHREHLPQPSKQLLAALEAHKAARLLHDAEAERLATDLAALTKRLYDDHGVQGTYIAEHGGVSRKAVYAGRKR